MNDLISRQAVIDTVKKNTFRLTFAEEQYCEGHVAWSANAVYSDVMERALLDLPSAQLERPKGKWIPLQLSLEHPPYQCSCCFSNPPMITKKDKWRKQHLEAVLSPYCPNCGARMDGDK